MKISDDRCFMLWCNLTSARENDITKNGVAVKGVPGRFGTMYGGFQPGDLVSIDDPPTSSDVPGKEA